MSEEIATLPASAAEIEDELRTQALNRISDVVIERREAEYQQRIGDHYAARAKNLMEPIWRDCLKRTGHKVEEVTDMGDYKKQMLCVTCHAPMTKDKYGQWVIERFRADAGFALLGRKLREADRRAEIEWIPDT